MLLHNVHRLVEKHADDPLDGAPGPLHLDKRESRLQQPAKALLLQEVAVQYQPQPGGEDRQQRRGRGVYVQVFVKRVDGALQVVVQVEKIER
jgi:hypothetical protein